MIKNCTVIALITLLFAGGCKNIESENSRPDKTADETGKMAVACTFLLRKLQDDNLNLIASKDDENLTLIRNIIRTDGLNLEVEDYNNIEDGPDLCHYSKSTKKAVAIIDVTKTDENSYYISYYIGPEGAASKELTIEKTNGRWTVLNDGGFWSIK